MLSSCTLLTQLQYVPPRLGGGIMPNVVEWRNCKKRAASNVTTSPFLWKRSRRMQNPSPQVKMEMVPTRNFACIDRCEHDSEGTSYALCKLDRLALSETDWKTVPPSPLIPAKLTPTAAASRRTLRVVGCPCRSSQCHQRPTAHIEKPEGNVHINLRRLCD